MTTGSACATIAIISNGTSAYVGWYEENVFGRYELTTDEIGGYPVYSETIKGQTIYLRYDASYGLWLVSSIPYGLDITISEYYFSQRYDDKIIFHHTGKSVNGRIWCILIE